MTGSGTLTTPSPPEAARHEPVAPALRRLPVVPLVDPARLRDEAGLALVVAGAGCLLGLVVGAVWALVAPQPVWVLVDGGLLMDSLTSGALVAADGWLGVLCLLAGLLLAVLAVRRWPHHPVGALAGLVAGGVAGAVVAAWLGQALCPADVVARAAGLPLGARVDGGLTLRAPGVLLFWPIASTLLVLAWAAWTDRARP
ncbi:MAG: hypothetical protein ACTHOD_22015 [Motilibacteraceae bacterium]